MLEFFRPKADLDAFLAVLGARSARWYGACFRITQDSGLAEDAVQEALLKAWDQRARFRGDADIDTWIHRIALNTAIDTVRRRGREPQSAPNSGDSGEVESESQSPLVSGEASHTPIEAAALGRDMDAALVALTAMERECFLLKHVEEWSLDEIAASQKTNPNNIKQALFRAVRKLRVSLADWRGE